MSTVNVVNKLMENKDYESIKNIAMELGYYADDKKVFDFAIGEEKGVIEDLCKIAVNQYFDITISDEAVEVIKELAESNIKQIYVNIPPTEYPFNREKFFLPIYEYEGYLYSQDELSDIFNKETPEVNVYYPVEKVTDYYNYEEMDEEVDVLSYNFGIKDLFYYKYNPGCETLCGYENENIVEEELEK